MYGKKLCMDQRVRSLRYCPNRKKARGTLVKEKRALAPSPTKKKLKAHRPERPSPHT
jgi:hypothetical protein